MSLLGACRNSRQIRLNNSACVEQKTAHFNMPKAQRSAQRGRSKRIAGVQVRPSAGKDATGLEMAANGCVVQRRPTGWAGFTRDVCAVVNEEGHDVGVATSCGFD